MFTWLVDLKLVHHDKTTNVPWHQGASFLKANKRRPKIEKWLQDLQVSTPILERYIELAKPTVWTGFGV